MDSVSNLGFFCPSPRENTICPRTGKCFRRNEQTDRRSLDLRIPPSVIIYPTPLVQMSDELLYSRDRHTDMSEISKLLNKQKVWPVPIEVRPIPGQEVRSGVLSRFPRIQ